MIGLLSILSPIEDVLTWALEALHTTFSLSWAWAIVALTIVVRVLLVPLTVKQIHSMQRMQQYLPEMKAIQKRYKADRRKQNEELMKFYKEHQINPASSCLPIIPQIPIFFALYFVLRDFDDEIYPDYPGSDLGWLQFVPDITANITSHWSGYVLLAVYVASQVASTWFMPTQSKGPAGDLPRPAVHLRDLHPRPARRHRVPRRSAHLLDDDQPLDRRPGSGHAWSAPEGGARAAEALVANSPEGRAGRRCGSRRAGRYAPAFEAGGPAAQGQAEEEEGRQEVNEELSVEATGETVGEAKWAALRELERLSPGLDKGAVQFQVVAEGERGLLGVGYTPARVVATVAEDGAAAPA